MISLVLSSSVIASTISATKKDILSQDRYFFKIINTVISQKDLSYLERNLKVLKCVFETPVLTDLFSSELVKNLSHFLTQLPSSHKIDDQKVRDKLKSHEKMMKKLRMLFKLLLYVKNQSILIRPQMIQLVRSTIKENKCSEDVFYKKSLKTNFLELLKLEIYLKSRYGTQMKKNDEIDVTKASLSTFVESLDKQYSHEYFW